MLSECRVERDRHKPHVRVTASGCQFAGFRLSDPQTEAMFFAKTYHGTQYKCE